MSIGAKITAGFALGLAIILAIGVSAYVSTQRLLEANRWVTHTHEVLEKLAHVLSATDEAEDCQRDFVLTGEERYLKPYNAATGEVYQDIQELANLTQDNPEQLQSLDQIRKLADAKLAILQETINVRRESGLEAAQAVVRTDRGRKAMNDLRAVIAEMKAREEMLLEERNTAADAAAHRTIWTIALWMPLSLVVLAVMAVIILRTVRFAGPMAPAGPSTPGGKWGGIAIRYSFAVLAVAVAVVLRWRLEGAFGPLPLFITFYPAVLLVASIAGGGPGILTAVLAALAADYWFILPLGFGIEASNDVLAVGIFTGFNLFLCILMERLRRARWAEAVTVAQEQQLEELSRLNEELSQQSEELSQQSEELSQQNEELQTQTEEIQTLNTELAHREDVLQKLLDAARLGSTEQAVMRDICAAAKEMFGPAASAVMVLEPQGSVLTIRAQAGLGPEGAKAESLPLAKCFAELVVAENRTAALTDAALRPDISLIRPPGEQPFRAVLAAPMRAEGRPFGVVGVYSHQPHEWTAEQFRLVEWLAAQCSQILETLRLQEQTRRQAAMLDLSPDGIMIRRVDGTITFWSRGAEKLYGWTKEEAVGQLTHTLLKTRYSEPLERIIEKLKDAGRWSGELVHHTKDGREVTVQSRWLTQADLDDPKVEILESNVDVTDRQRAEDALKQTAAELARSNQDLEQFAYVASHDLQEPLRVVGGFVQLLQQRYAGKLDAKADEYIEFAVDGAKRMQALIQDLLAYARVGTRGKELEATESAEAVRQALANLRAVVEETGAEITFGELPTVRGDETQLAQLFQNLIGNALKFRGEAPPRVRVEACREDQHWHFSVRDNGIGIDPQYQDRIFLIFQRLHTRGDYPGTGIGLALCKKIVDRHGGRIWVESQPEQGATFHFTIPAGS